MSLIVSSGIGLISSGHPLPTRGASESTLPFSFPADISNFIFFFFKEVPTYKQLFSEGTPSLPKFHYLTGENNRRDFLSRSEVH